MKLKLAGATALALLTCGCGISQVDSKESDQEAARFYQQIAAKQYEAAYQQSAPELRNATTQEIFVGLMKRIDRKLGACQAPVKAAAWRVNVTTNGTLRDQGYTRACANGPLSETVTTITRGHQTKLAGYHAESPLLLVD